MKNLVVGVDCSTTASKAIVWDISGRLVAQGRRDYPLLMPRPAWHEQDAEMWWTATARALLEATAAVDPRRLAALCITHQRETFVPVDEAGRPLRNAILWMDERCRSQLSEIESACGGTRFHQVTGKPLSGNLSIGKILWLKENEPGILARAFKFVDVHAFLVHHLTGQFRTGWGCADPTGLFDTQQHRWAEKLVHAAGLRMDQLPDVFAPGAVLGEVTPEASRACGLPAGLPVVAGLGDGQSAGLGANVAGEGIAYLSLGTSVVSGTGTERYVVDRAFRTMTGGVPRSFLLETVILSGGYIVQWFLERFAHDQPDERVWETAIQSVPPGSNGLLLVPYWNSAMGPYWDTGASGLVVGWRGVHDRAHFYRAILEGIAFEQRLCTGSVEAATGQPIERFIAMGGGARSAAWLQIMADITGKPVAYSTTSEAAALGAAILAASAAGLYRDPQEAATAMAASGRRDGPAAVEPDARRHEFYSRLYDEVYRHLFPALQPYLQRLTELAAHAKPGSVSGD